MLGPAIRSWRQMRRHNQDQDEVSPKLPDVAVRPCRHNTHDMNRTPRPDSLLHHRSRRRICRCGSGRSSWHCLTRSHLAEGRAAAASCAPRARTSSNAHRTELQHWLGGIPVAGTPNPSPRQRLLSSLKTFCSLLHIQAMTNPNTAVRTCLGPAIRSWRQMRRHNQEPEEVSPKLPDVSVRLCRHNTQDMNQTPRPRQPPRAKKPPPALALLFLKIIVALPSTFTPGPKAGWLQQAARFERAPEGTNTATELQQCLGGHSSGWDPEPIGPAKVSIKPQDLLQPFTYPSHHKP